MMAVAFAIREHVRFSGVVAVKMLSYLMGTVTDEFERAAVLGQAIDQFLSVTDSRPLTAAEDAALTPEGRQMREHILQRQAMELVNGPRAQA